MEALLINLVSEYGILAIVASFGIGALTSLAPCSIITLPLLVGAALGMSESMKDDKRARFTLVFSLLFVLGLIASFSILAFAVAKLGVFFSVAPIWAYVLAAVVTLLIALQGFGVLVIANKDAMVSKLIRFRLFGAFFIGVIFGLISTPCASAPLAAIITAASASGDLYAYAMTLALALGHGMLLLIAGISLGFTQKVVANKHLGLISLYVGKFFSALLVVFAFYFAFKAYEQF